VKRVVDHSLVITAFRLSAKALNELASIQSVNTFLTKKSLHELNDR
jgi:hypothetical protein